MKKINIKIQASSATNMMALSIETPNELTRFPCDICVVLDVSGSMGIEAIMKNQVGKTEAYGLTVLDLVKHATRTIIHNLQPCDRLSLVTFST